MVELSRRQLLGAAAAAGSATALAACSPTLPAENIDTSGPPRKGGTLRVGLVGGSTADTVDAHIPASASDAARVVNLYEPLVRRGYEYELENRLAESLEPNEDATEWTIRLREGVKFSDGRPVRPEDVTATYERVADPDDPKNGAGSIAHIEAMNVVDDRTLTISLSRPDATLTDALAEYQMGIVPEDYDPENPIGAGPFKLVNFSAGRETIMERNEHYFLGPANLDRVEVVDFYQEDAMLNALLSSQVDGIGALNHALVRVIESDPRMHVVSSESGMWLPFTMRVDHEPFDDERVRQAMRLACARSGMVDQVFSGEGQVGNDMFALYDPAYPHEFPQREQNIEEAKKLLADAGYPDGIDVTLATSEIASGAVRAAQVFTEQVREAGIRVKIDQVDSTTFWADGNYLSYPFSQTFYYTRNFLEQVNRCATEDAPFNETHWADPDFTARVEAARAIVDDRERGEKIKELQREFYDRGGYIIWGFPNQVDAYHNYVAGAKPHPSGVALSQALFYDMWIAEA